MQLVQQWGEIERSLPEGWAELDLALTLAENAQGALAASLLEPLAAALEGESVVRLHLRRGDEPLARRLMARLEQDNVDGVLEARRVAMAEEPVEPTWTELVAAWDLLLAMLPQDWSDLYLELEVTSGDPLDRVALRLAPANPARSDPSSLRFRAARSFGYGVAPAMLRRCLARLDEEGVRGTLRALRVLVDGKPVATQGPVWRMAGKSV